MTSEPGGALFSMNNTLDLLQRATTRLSQEGTLKDRLADAYASHLVGVDAAKLPDSVRHDFAALRVAMHRERPLPGENVIRASVRKMSNDEAGRHAALVVRVFATLARAETSNVGLRRSGRNAAAAPVLQLFAAEG